MLFMSDLDKPVETEEQSFIRFTETGGINELWFENQMNDFDEELDWFRYRIIFIR